jgi:hypothetical protein
MSFHAAKTSADGDFAGLGASFAGAVCDFAVLGKATMATAKDTTTNRIRLFRMIPSECVAIIDEKTGEIVRALICRFSRV